MVENLTLEKMLVSATCVTIEHKCMSQEVFEGSAKDVRQPLCIQPEYTLADQKLTPSLRMKLKHTSKFKCTVCGRDTKKLFDACCFPCFQSSAQADRCLLNPVNCHYSAGTCREPKWGEENCYRPHYLYLAFTDKLKVGITRSTQVPTRWIDQGATVAVLLAKAGSRHQVGILESYLSSRFADKSHWLKMLKTGNNKMSMPEFEAARQEAIGHLKAGLSNSESSAQLSAPVVPSCPDAARVDLLSNAPMCHLEYPLWSGVPEKITSMNLDKSPLIESRILGVKGQYLFLESGVLNVRRHEGYVVDCELLD